MSEQEEFEFRHRLEQEHAAAAVPPAPAPEEGFGSRLVRSGLEALPGIGGVAGGVVGAVPTLEAGGLGAIPGAALGYAGGKQLERLGKQYLLGDKEDNVPTAPLEQVKQVGGDLAEGAAFEAGGQALAPVLSAAAKPVKEAIGKPVKSVSDYIAKKLGYGAFKIPEETTARYMANPEAVNAAGTLREEADALPGAISEMRGNLKRFSEEARGALSGDRTGAGVPLEDVLSFLDKAAERAPGVKSIRDNLMKEYSGRLGQVDRAGTGNVTEQEVRKIIDELKDHADWTSQIPDSQKSAANAAHGQLNQVLRDRNAGYEELMGDSAATAQARTRIIKKFGLERDPSSPEGYATTDRTVSAIKDLSRADKADREQALQDVADLGYPDLAEKFRAALDKVAFTKDATNGSRMVNMGRAVGRLAGPYGEAVGGAVGGVADRFGTAAFKNGLDTKAAVEQSTAPQLSKTVSSYIANRVRSKQEIASDYVQQQTDSSRQQRLKDEQEGR